MIIFLKHVSIVLRVTILFHVIVIHHLKNIKYISNNHWHVPVCVYVSIVHHCSVNVRWESAFAFDYPVGLQNQLIDHNNNMGWINFLLKQSLFSYLFQMNINIRNKVCFCDWRMFRIVTRLEKLLSRNPLLTNCITYGSLSGNFSGFHLSSEIHFTRKQTSIRQLVLH